MTAQELKSKLTIDNIKKLLDIMGATIYFEDDTQIITDTICHHGKKPKLYFYKDDMMFHCYTDCGQMDILGLVIGYNDYESNDIHKAIDYICTQLGINQFSYGVFGSQEKEKVSDWNFIKGYRQQTKKVQNNNSIDNSVKIIDNNILNIFQDVYTKEWINDGISIESMQKYNIKYCSWQSKIIIPHYNLDNQLIGVRARALIEDEIEMWGKYAPFRIGDKLYNHSLGKNLYGLNRNIKAIKQKRKIMLVESEKAVLQCDTMFGDDNFTVALCGKNLTIYQRNILRLLGIQEVIIALDRQYEHLYSKEANIWKEHIEKKIIKPLLPYFTVSVIWDEDGLLGYKDSPTDKGKDTLLKLMKNKITVTIDNFI